MSRIIIFGSGGVGIKAMHKLQAEGNEIICFTDNNRKKWGTVCEGLAIIAPEQIMHESFDYVAIGVFKAVEPIRQQLKGMHIADERIIVPVEPDRIFLNGLKFDETELDKPDPDSYFSRNTQTYEEMHIQICDSEFLRKLEDLKKVLKQNRIPRNRVCVVSGAVLQVFALRETKEFDDVDIIMTSDLREQYGKGLVIVSDTAEMHRQNLYTIPDDNIIMNPEYHFVFSDLKFMCPGILVEYTKEHDREEYELLLKLREFYEAGGKMCDYCKDQCRLGKSNV